MEHVLKLEEFAHLREMAQYPQAICPSHKLAFPIIQEMIDQILRAHPNSKYLHIGCDEVFQLGVCSKCREKMRRLGMAERRHPSHQVRQSDSLKTNILLKNEKGPLADYSYFCDWPLEMCGQKTISYDEVPKNTNHQVLKTWWRAKCNQSFCKDLILVCKATSISSS